MTHRHTESFHATAVVFAQDETQVDKKFESKFLLIPIELNLLYLFLQTYDDLMK